MKDLNKLKEEEFLKHREFKIGLMQDWSADSFYTGWDACVKAQETDNRFENRKQEFESDTASIIQKFFNVQGSNLYADFVPYWTEPNKSKTKMRFELEKTWDTKRRLQTWIRNDKKFNPKETVGGKKEAVRMEGRYMDRFGR